MFRILFINEIHQHVLRQRFVMLMPLVFLLFSVAAVSVKPSDAAERASDRTRAEGRSLPLFALVQQPFQHRLGSNPIAFCVSGRLKYLPNVFTFDSLTFREVKLGHDVDENLFFPNFLQLDWVFLISTLVVFVILVLTFDAVCGDKESGVLRLVLSYPVPRGHLFLAKYLASLVIVLVPFFFALICSLILIRWRGIGVGPTEYATLGIIVLLSILLLSLYTLLGLLISSRTTRSEVSLLVLALCLTAFTVLIPGISTVLARQLNPLASDREIQHKIEAAYEEAGRRIRYADVDLRVRHTASNLRDAHRQQQFEQARVSANLAFLSPNFIYEEACMDMAGRGVWRIHRTINHLKRHVQVMDDFILETDRADPSSRHAGLVHYKTLSHKPVNLSQVPQFTEKDPGVAECFSYAVPNMVILLLLNLVVAYLGLISTRKYDAR